ncbi:MAG: hypothetical protein ACJ75H_14610 [Thermoanaerobaculia bacterium]
MPVRKPILIESPAPQYPSFWHRPSIDELMRQQGTRPVECIDDLLGGWPEDQIDDGFEEALKEWRRADHQGED